MNKLTIIGNMTADPEKRVTQNGKTVASFTVAVNEKKGEDATFFRCTAWERTAENVLKFTHKGSKICVIGPVGQSVFKRQNGEPGGSLEVNAREVEFLDSRGGGEAQEGRRDAETGYSVVDDDDVPF